jgi:iron complex outermembrane receptor protein
MSTSNSYKGAVRATASVLVLRPHALTLAIGGLLALNAAQAQVVAQASGADSIIVTGTRATGTKATDSVSPIAVVGAAELEKTGQASVIDALLRLEPTFGTQAKGTDLANMVRSASLRGLSANQTLVLVNGKRRNTTSYLNTTGFTAGSSAVDLDFIPTSSVERVEVLKDGAAAQYGSDAIAGVLNIILKSNTSGSLELGYGRFADSKVNPNMLGNGRTRSVALDKGFALGTDGFVHLSGEFRDHLHTNQTGPELRSQNTNVALSGGPVDPYVPITQGDPAYTLASLGYNAGFNFTPDLELYSFGNVNSRKADSWQNNRPNEKASASTCFYPPGSTVVIKANKPGAADTNGCSTISVSELAKAYYPGGFFIPSETLEEKNLALAVGLRGSFWGDARWDVSLSYGTDVMDIGVANSLNYAYLLTPIVPNATHPNGKSPTSAYIGQYGSSQTLLNVDVAKPFDIGLYAPLDVAVGMETRKDGYEIKAGDTAGWSNGGMQGFIGMTPQDAKKVSRTESAVYLDLNTNFSKAWIVGAAVRYENFSDAGKTTTGKLSSRYDFSPMFALRGTASTGFRAATLSEQYFTTTNVGPTSASVILPSSSPAAALVGGKPLTPEESKNVSLGLVITPSRNLRFTADAYVIKIKDRILQTSVGATSTIPGYSGPNGAVRQAIALQGVVLPPTANDNGTSVVYYANSIDLTTKGIDLIMSTGTDLAEYGKINWNFAANFKRTTVDRYNPNIFLPAALAGLTDTPPKNKIVASGDWTVGAWSTTLRVTRFGEAKALSTPANTPSYPTTPYTEVIVKAAFIPDIEVGYKASSSFQFAAGINNFINKTPDHTPDNILYGPSGLAPTAISSTGVGVYPTFAPYGINGAYYYLRGSYKF